MEILQKNLIAIAKELGRLGIDGVQFIRSGRHGTITVDKYEGVLDCHLPAELSNVRLTLNTPKGPREDYLLQYALEDALNMFFDNKSWFANSGGKQSIEVQSTGIYIFNSWTYKETQHQDKKLSGDILTDEQFPPANSLY